MANDSQLTEVMKNESQLKIFQSKKINIYIYHMRVLDKWRQWEEEILGEADDCRDKWSSHDTSWPPFKVTNELMQSIREFVESLDFDVDCF